MLDVQNVCISIDRKLILTDLSFQVSTGETCIILGKNGSGKSLLLNLFASMIKPTSGTVTINGLNVFTNLDEVRPQIGFIPTDFDVYSDLTTIDYLNFFSKAYKLDKTERKGAIEAVIELMDIQDLRHTLIGRLSKGERHRLLYAKTFLHDPVLWLIDDPLSTLDPQGKLEVAELLNELKDIGKTLVIATNQLDDVYRFCNLNDVNSSKTTLLGILHDNTIAFFNTLHHIQEQFKKQNNYETLNANWLYEFYLEVTRE
ncbi:ABC transporter ATP-binding protein [Candidatus Poribacteria bacterium]|nr:ABC transporter ATP-binding protein [Candidatus Poribacteria bacterium]